MGYVQHHRVSFLRRFGLKTGIPFAYVGLACVAGAKRAGGGGGRKAQILSKYPFSPLPPSFFPFFPYPLPFSTPATQANVDLESGMVFEGTTRPVAGGGAGGLEPHQKFSYLN